MHQTLNVRRNGGNVPATGLFSQRDGLATGMCDPLEVILLEPLSASLHLEQRILRSVEPMRNSQVVETRNGRQLVSRSFGFGAGEEDQTFRSAASGREDRQARNSGGSSARITPQRVSHAMAQVVVQTGLIGRNV
jgi:hypothetical protein